MNELKTGDLILFSSYSSGISNLISNFIKWGTHSNYTHIAMVLKDPDFIGKSLKGLYVWESGWEEKPDPVDNKIKMGVQITPLEEILNSYKNNGHCYIRKLINSDKYITSEKLSEIYITT
tara:strand:+ start:154 stop:513 length:360 start_codon:yes stop_codon:yes gene_type:complete